MPAARPPATRNLRQDSTPRLPAPAHATIDPMRSLLLPKRAGGTPASWRRTLFVAFLAQTLALMGFTLIFPFLPLYIQTLGVHGPAVPVWAGIISFSSSLPLAVMGPVW